MNSGPSGGGAPLFRRFGPSRSGSERSIADAEPFDLEGFQLGSQFLIGLGLVDSRSIPGDPTAMLTVIQVLADIRQLVEDALL